MSLSAVPRSRARNVENCSDAKLRASVNPLTGTAGVDDRSPLVAELDRVGASFREAGAADFVAVQLGLEEVKLLGPPREHPRRSWLGPEWQALELLGALPDDAGVRALWLALRARGL